VLNQSEVAGRLATVVIATLDDLRDAVDSVEARTQFPSERRRPSTPRTAEGA
jgi:hypothetical protein